MDRNIRNRSIGLRVPIGCRMIRGRYEGVDLQLDRCTWSTREFVEASLPTCLVIWHLAEGLLSRGVGESRDILRVRRRRMSPFAHDMHQGKAQLRAQSRPFYIQLYWMHSFTHTRDTRASETLTHSFESLRQRVIPFPKNVWDGGTVYLRIKSRAGENSRDPPVGKDFQRAASTSQRFVTERSRAAFNTAFKGRRRSWSFRFIRMDKIKGTSRLRSG